MAAIFDLPNTSALINSRLGIYRKSEEYNMFYICVKCCSFGRICPKLSLTAPTKTFSLLVKFVRYLCVGVSVTHYVFFNISSRTTPKLKFIQSKIHTAYFPPTPHLNICYTINENNRFYMSFLTIHISLSL